MMKIIITEKISDNGIQLLQAAKDVQLDLRDGISREELLQVIPNYDGIIVRSITKIDEEFYQHASPRLKVVGRAGVGVDNIDTEGATKRGIIVVNTPESNIISAAELTIGLLLASARNIPRAHNRLLNKVWDRKGLQGAELFGKTVGIIGLGRIGSLVATRLQSFGMRVIAYDPYIADARFEKFNAEKKETLAELLKEADFITVHTPKTEETFGMLGEEELKLVKKGVRVVNCARGGIFNEDALLKALKAGIVASAGIDVLMDEPYPTSPLIDVETCVLTPHIGADTAEAQYKVGLTIAQEVLAALRGEMVPNAVNLPTLHPQEFEAMKHYLSLGEMLGKLYYQLEKEAVERVTITYKGEVAALETTMLTRAVLKGLFEPILKDQVNFVNARLVAENRGVAVAEAKETAAGNYLNLIKVEIASKQGVFTISGTVFGRHDLRIVEVCGYEFDVTPSPYMLVAQNSDKPGMIGQIGTLLGVSKVNIATMQVSRNHKENKALMFLTVDSVVDKDTLKMIGGVDGIIKANFIKL